MRARAADTGIDRPCHPLDIQEQTAVLDYPSILLHAYLEATKECRTARILSSPIPRISRAARARWDDESRGAQTLDRARIGFIRARSKRSGDWRCEGQDSTPVVFVAPDIGGGKRPGRYQGMQKALTPGLQRTCHKIKPKTHEER